MGIRGIQDIGVTRVDKDISSFRELYWDIRDVRLITDYEGFRGIWGIESIRGIRSIGCNKFSRGIELATGAENRKLFLSSISPNNTNNSNKSNNTKSHVNKKKYKP